MERKRLELYYEQSRGAFGLACDKLSKIILDGKQVTLLQIPVSPEVVGIPTLEELRREYIVAEIYFSAGENLVRIEKRVA